MTNGNADLVKIGINHLFFDVIYAADFGYAKPDIKIFNEAIRRSGVNKKDIYHVGDHPVNDIVGAQKAGLRTIWMNPIITTSVFFNLFNSKQVMKLIVRIILIACKFY